MKIILKSVMFSFCFIFLLGMKSFSFAAYPPCVHPSVYVNNEKLDIYTACVKDVTIVPFRPIFEKYNMDISWDAKTKKVTL